MSYAKLLQEHSEQKLALDELHSKLAESETANECLRRQLKKMQLEKAYHDQSEAIALPIALADDKQGYVSKDYLPIYHLTKMSFFHELH